MEWKGAKPHIESAGKCIRIDRLHFHSHLWCIYWRRLKFWNKIDRDQRDWPMVRLQSFVAEVICDSLSWYWYCVLVINASSFSILLSRFSCLEWFRYDSIIVKYRSIHCPLFSDSNTESSISIYALAYAPAIQNSSLIIYIKKNVGLVIIIQLDIVWPTVL